MDTVDFLRAVLGAGGNYCLFAAVNGKKKQKFYPTIQQLADAARQFDAEDGDVYFGLATFVPGTDRKAANAVELGAMFLDLDCGPEKDYPDQPTAIEALRNFVKHVGLPKPLMVNSGYGVHVYWPLSQSVPAKEWKPVAESLKSACAKLGLPTDGNVTADAARILRVPGTRNFKKSTPAPVHVLGMGRAPTLTLAQFSEILAPYAVKKGAALFDTPVALSARDDPVMQRLLNNRTASFKRIVERGIAGTGCVHLVNAIVDPASTDEPSWRAALSIAKFCSEGSKAAHRISRGHPDYDEDETEAKLDGIKGPYTCDTFDGIVTGICASCPHKGRITSPIQLGSVVEEADEDAPIPEPTVIKATTNSGLGSLPFPYFRGKTGGIYIRQKDENGDPEEVLVYLNDLYYTQRVLDPTYGECVIGRLRLPNDEQREFVVPLVAATSKEELRKILSKYGVSVSAKRWDTLMAYTGAWIDQLQTTTTADTARTQFGWSDNNFTSYVIGDREIFADRVGYNPPSAKTSFLFPALRPRGTLEGWIEQAKFYDRDGLEPYQFVVCQALAAPLMRLSPVHAAIFDFYSDGSGHGKSTTQKFALTAYGDPDELIMGPKDTINARMNRLELMKDVNVQFDEFTEFPAEHTSDLIYGITDGRQKARMAAGANEERHRGEAWYTTVCASSNHSMLAKVYMMKSNPRAEVQRVLRYHVQPHNFTEKSETDDFAKSVGKNTGHAIEVFVRRVMRDIATTKQLFETVQRQLDNACDLTMQNRFWSVQGAATITALILAKDEGLLSYDPAKLFAWVVDLIKKNKQDDRDSTTSIETMINEFVNENYGSILWIKSSEDLRGKNTNGLDNLVVPDMLPRVKLMARYETDVKRLYIPVGALRSWCNRRRLNADSVMKEIVERMNGSKIRMRLGKGTKLDMPPSLVMALDCGDIQTPEVSGGNTT